MASENGAGAQTIARYVLTVALVVLGGWMLRHFLSPLAWAVVIGIATSPWYDRWLAMFSGRFRHAFAALSFTLLVGLLVIVPLIYGGYVAAKEGVKLTHSFLESWRTGTLDVPTWITNLPVAGAWVRQAVAQGMEWGKGPHHIPGAGTRNAVLEWTRLLGYEVFRRIVTLVFTLLALYFVYRNRERLQNEVPLVCQRLFGPTVQRLLLGAASAIRATVDGVVIVAMAEGVIMAGVYAAAGASHPIFAGVITGVFAMIPFAAPLVFGVVGLMLLAKGALTAAIVVVAAGSIVLFVADHFVRPAIIGGGAQLPFLWVLLGILGGIESFGLLGIFLGPALMAALVSLWRGWVSEEQRSNGGTGAPGSLPRTDPP